MLLYYPFWMFMGFILHIYIIFGTNLLTGGATRIAVFLPISVFRRKGISNGVQTEWNRWERDFWNERDPEDLECKSRSSRGSYKIGGRAPYLVGPSGGHRCTSSSYLYPYTPKTSTSMIRLQRIYNFSLFHAIILPLLDVYGLYFTHIYHFWD